jgi:hypothetical protein
LVANEITGTLVEDLWSPKGVGAVRRSARAMRRIPALGIGSCIVGAYIAVAVLAPLIAPKDPLALDYNLILVGASQDAYLGTDDLGRDTLSRVIFACRTALRVATLAVTIALLLGVSLGIAGGYFRGWVDYIVRSLIDIVNRFNIRFSDDNSGSRNSVRCGWRSDKCRACRRDHNVARLCTIGAIPDPEFARVGVRSCGSSLRRSRW